MKNLNRKQKAHHFQHTINDSFTCIGRGLHSGLKVIMTVMPAEANSGIVFHRRDVEHKRAEIPARWNTVTDTRMSTTIANASGIGVSTIEHLMAALYACGIDNARVILDAPEVPIMDGSAKPFVDLIKKTGKCRLDEPRKAIVISRDINVDEGYKFASLRPARRPQVEFELDFEQAAIGRQQYRGLINESLFDQDLAAARTFGFKDQLQTLQKLGLARGGSLRNAVLVDDDVVINEEGLRFNDEFVRHKVLDAVGDMALIGMPIIGKFSGHCSGHKLNNALLHELMLNEHCWHYTTLEDAENNWEQLVKNEDNANRNNAKLISEQRV